MKELKERRSGSNGARRGVTRREAAREAETAPAIVKLTRYCELTGDTPDAVHMRRRRGEWVDGRHCYLIGGRRLWIDLTEVNAWLRNGGIQAN